MRPGRKPPVLRKIQGNRRPFRRQSKCGVQYPGIQAHPESKNLSLVTQPLLVPVRLHALTALMFGDFGFAAFFD
jgi:hypothetical protein